MKLSLKRSEAVLELVLTYGQDTVPHIGPLRFFSDSIMGLKTQLLAYFFDKRPRREPWPMT